MSTSPAMPAGVANHVWTIADLVAMMVGQKERTMAGEKPKEGSWWEKREWVRYRGAPDASCALSLGDEPKTGALRIENISVAGIMLAVDGTLPIGAVAHVELSRPAQNFTCTRQMRIVYAFRASSGDYLIGGSFTRPLSDVELQSLL